MFIVIFFREQGAGSREQGAGSREQRAGSREQGAGSVVSVVSGVSIPLQILCTS